MVPSFCKSLLKFYENEKRVGTKRKVTLPPKRKGCFSFVGKGDVGLGGLLLFVQLDHHFDFLTAEQQAVVLRGETFQLLSRHSVSTELVRHQAHVNAVAVAIVSVVDEIEVVEAVTCELIAQDDVPRFQAPSSPAVTDTVGTDVLIFANGFAVLVEFMNLHSVEAFGPEEIKTPRLDRVAPRSSAHWSHIGFLR